MEFTIRFSFCLILCLLGPLAMAQDRLDEFERLRSELRNDLKNAKASPDAIERLYKSTFERFSVRDLFGVAHAQASRWTSQNDSGDPVARAKLTLQLQDTLMLMRFVDTSDLWSAAIEQLKDESLHPEVRRRLLYLTEFGDRPFKLTGQELLEFVSALKELYRDEHEPADARVDYIRTAEILLEREFRRVFQSDSSVREFRESQKRWPVQEIVSGTLTLSENTRAALSSTDESMTVFVREMIELYEDTSDPTLQQAARYAVENSTSIPHGAWMQAETFRKGIAPNSREERNGENTSVRGEYLLRSLDKYQPSPETGEEE